MSQVEITVPLTTEAEGRRGVLVPSDMTWSRAFGADSETEDSMLIVVDEDDLGRLQEHINGHYS